MPDAYRSHRRRPRRHGFVARSRLCVVRRRCEMLRPISDPTGPQRVSLRRAYDGAVEPEGSRAVDSEGDGWCDPQGLAIRKGGAVRRRRLWAILALCTLVLAAACSSDDGEAAARRTEEAAATELIVGISWNNYNEERWAKWDEPAIKEALAAGGAEYISTDAGSLDRAAAHRHREPDLAGRRRADHPRPGRRGDPAGGAERPGAGHPGDRVRPSDRGSRCPVHHVRQRRGRTDAGGGRSRPGPEGQLRLHQGQLRRRERGLPAEWPARGPAGR